MKAFDGTLFNRKETEEYLNSIPKASLSWVKHLTLHNTGAPNMAQEDKTPGGEAQRMRNLGHYYKKWGGRGPHFFTFNSGKIGLGTCLPGQGVHSPSWNKISVAVEMVADFRKGVDNPYTEPGLTITDNTAWLFAQLLKKLGLQASNDTIKLHKEDKATTHDCPGNLFLKADFIERVRTYMGVKAPEAYTAPTQTPVTVPGKIMEPGKFGYSSYAVDMLKRIEGLRLEPYNDRGTLAIGYGHNASSGQPPVVTRGMKITPAQAETILLSDMNECLRYINAWVKVPLEQGQVDALILLIFQQGATNFRKKFVAMINEKKHWTVAKMMENYVFASDPTGGLDRRFELQAKIYRGERPTKW
jgi:GH24 family phage-related lysozyme (muramidase)